MNEILKLKNGQEYPLPVDGVSLYKEKLKVRIVVSDDVTIADIKAVFSDKENVQELQVMSDGIAIRLYDDYVVLGSKMSLDTHAVIDIKVIATPAIADEETDTLDPAESIPVDPIPETETIYGSVVELELSKEGISEQVITNRADIDYLLMMEE